MADADEREIEKFQKEKRKAEKKNNLREVAKLCNYIGELLAKHGRFSEAISEHETELALSEALEDTIGAAVASRKVGECYCELGQYDKALHHQERHLSLAQSCDDHVEEQRAWATIGRTHLFQAETSKESGNIKNQGKNLQALKKAENAFVKSLEVCQLIKASVSNKEYMEMKARLLLNLGLIYDYRSDVKKCAEYIKQAIFIAEKHALSEDLYRCQMSLCGIYVRHNKLSSALRSVEVALQSAVKVKDKCSQCEALLLKAQIQIELEDFEAGKRCLRKAHKLHCPVESERKKIELALRAAVILYKSHEQLEETDTTDFKEKAKLFEKLGDNAAHLANYRQAIKYYLSMLECAESFGMELKKQIPIFVSLAQTYVDNKQYDKAKEFYLRELKCRNGDFEQECRTWLNIAEAEELGGEEYQTVGNAYLSALAAARKAKHRKLQVLVLKSLTLCQQMYGQKEDYQRTKEKLKQTREKYGISSDDELSEPEDSQGLLEDEVDINDLSETDDSDAEEFDRSKTSENATQKPRRARMNVRRNEKGETPLHRACIEGNLSKVKKLVEQGHPVNPRDHCGWLPLHEAANHDYLSIVEYLVDNGAWLNDRGGQHCGGVTPLHDAANCGNLDVVRLLISKGVNVLVKDDEGCTALDSLIDYRQRSQDSMTQQELSECMDTEKKLKNIMTGNNPHNSSTIGFAKSTRIMCEDLEEMPEIVKRSRCRSNLTNLKNSQAKTRTPYVEDNEDAENLSPEDTDNEDLDDSIIREYEASGHSHSDFGIHRENDENSEEIRRTKKRSITVLDEDDSDVDTDVDIYLRSQSDSARSKTADEQATEVYKEALLSVGSSVRRAQVRQTMETSSKPDKSAKEKPALILQNQAVGDDWLVDDMRPTKRKKYDIDKVFTTRSTREQREHNATASRESARPARQVVEENSENAGEEIEDDGIISDIVDIDDENMNINEDEVVSTFPVTRPSSQTLRNKQSRQLKLTKFTSSSRKTLHTPPIRSDRHFSATPRTEQNQTSSMMRVKVKVKDKLFLIPVPDSAEKTVAWLAQETANRYYSMCGLKPVLTLCTTEGAILTEADLITGVLSTNEEVQAVVDSWDLPPLPDRYKQACQATNSVAYRNICTMLQSCQASAVLNLNHLALRAAQFHPICRALQCQYSLAEIHLQGNRIGDGGLQQLITALATMPMIKTLDISANEITHNGIRYISDALHAQTVSANAAGAPPTEGTQKPLQMLEHLNLSFNPLGDSCNQYLTAAIKNIPTLQSLLLESCHLTVRFFQTHRVAFAEALKGIHLELLDISHNHLTAAGLELLLMSLPALSIKSLNLAGTVHSYTNNCCPRQLAAYVTKPNCSLETLDLSACHLAGEDVDDICSMVKQSKSLQVLNLSHNVKITNHDAKSLLIASLANSSALHTVTFTGCGMKAPLDLDFLDAFSEKLSHQMSPLEELSFSCADVSKVDVECLQSMWRDRWGESSVCSVQDGMITLKRRRAEMSF